MIRRREFITLLGSAAAAWPITAHAQQPERMRRIGVLMTIAEDDPEARIRRDTLHRRLEELGWTDGRDVRVDYRWPGPDPGRIKTSARELVGSAPDVMLSHTPAGVVALQQESRTVPIVFVQVADPVAAGLVASLARPGGNATGFTNFEYEMGEKWLELLKEVAPQIVRAVVISNPQNPSSALFMRTIEAAATLQRVQLTRATLQDADPLADGLNGGTGVIVLPDVAALAHRDRLIDLTARYRSPAVYPYRFYAAAGGLISYGVDNIDQWRQAAGYLDRILRGAKPADLPVQQPTKFELIINLKTAKALGLTVPPSLLARADEVIE
jgi:ABC-type uncharacterized transport system substrate-binding protein